MRTLDSERIEHGGKVERAWASAVERRVSWCVTPAMRQRVRRDDAVALGEDRTEVGLRGNQFRCRKHHG